MQLNECKKEFSAVIDFLRQEISGLRTGRASVAMVDAIMVEAYGSRQPLKGCASITVSDHKTLLLEPWDKGLLSAVEKGIRDSGLGVNPVNDGKSIRLILPDLTADRRKELVKILGQKLEQARISLRKVREEVRERIAKEEKEKTMSEDDKFRLQEELEKMVKEFNELVKTIGEEKEKEIMTI